MTALNLRPDFRAAFGPGNFRMPNDPAPVILDWNAAYGAHVTAIHEDSEDRLNADGTWGAEPFSYGGSGINFGYSSPDLDAVLVAEKAVYARPVRYDWEHWIRQIRYPIAAWEMTHDTKYARRIVAYDTLATGALTDDPSTVHMDDPGFIPFTLAQYHAMALVRPSIGVPLNMRAGGWIAYGRAMRHKIDRKCSAAWALQYLEMCEMAAQPGTGQVGNWQENTPFDFEATGLTYTFHEAINLHAVLCLCIRLHKPVPAWCLDLMTTISALPQMDYYGMQSPVSYWKTVDGVAVPVDALPDGTPQHGDPAFAYWSTNCVALHKLQPEADWMGVATHIGPTVMTDEQSRKLTMLLRGQLG